MPWCQICGGPLLDSVTYCKVKRITDNMKTLRCGKTYLICRWPRVLFVPYKKLHMRQVGKSETRWIIFYGRVRLLTAMTLEHYMQQRHMSVITSQIISNSTLFNSLLKLTTKKTPKNRIYWLFVKGIHRWPVDSLTNGKKAFPCRDVIMHGVVNASGATKSNRESSNDGVGPAMRARIPW